MKTLLFYYHGPAKGLPLALLKHETAALQKQNKEVRQIFDTQFIAKLVYASENLNTKNDHLARSAIRSILRPKL